MTSRDAAIGLEVGDGSTIHQNVGVGAAAAIGEKFVPVSPTEFESLMLFIPGAEPHKIQHVTVNQGQIIDEPAIDHLARHRVLGLEALRLGLDVNGLLRDGDLQAEVCRRVLADVQRDVGTHRFLKAFHFRGHGIQSRRNGCEHISPAVVRRGGKLVSLLLVSERNLRPWH